MQDSPRSEIVPLSLPASAAGDDAGLFGSGGVRLRGRDPWLAVLAHELRGPLGAVLLAVDELRPSCSAEPGARAACESIERGARHMAGLIEDVLDLSRGEPDRTEAAHGPADVEVAVAGALAAARPLIVARHHRVHLDLPRNLAPVAARPSRVQQVLTNLLVNAAKFTPPGGQIIVSGSALRTAGEPVAHAVVLRVADTGIGLTADQQARVFDPGYRGPSGPPGPGSGGLGLGLSVVKTLVKLYGGRVAVHSDGPHRGSKFTVQLPAFTAAPSEIV